ncbi:MAG: hypothetical protein KC457_17410, partial [Myxococcales bacterium]|nr:hypothetical protein [Myxococcales bacterium]
IERRHAAVSVGLDEVTADPGLRWMFWMHYDGGRRSSSYELVNLATGTVNSGLEWSQSEYGNYGYYEETERDGYWRSDLSTSWIEQFMETSGNYDDGTLTMGWGALSVEPEPAVYQQIVIDGANSNDTAELELYAANAGDALMSWTHCKDDESDCREEPLVIADCEPLDGSPQLNLVLAECETGLALVEPGLPRRRDRPGRIVARLPLRPDADYRWGRGGTLALSEPGGRFAVVDPMTGAIGLERGDVDGFAEVALAIPRNWQGVISKGFLEIIDLGTGKTVVRVPEPIGRAGISPDGRRLAVARPTIEIWSLEAGEFDGQAHQAGELLSKLSIPEIDKEEHKSLDVAWRQDGAALLIGHGVPELQYTLADRQTLALNLEDVDEEQVDPSWRWIHLEEHEVMRLLDRRVLSYEPAGTSGVDGWARLDDGQFEGAPPPDDGARYRADEDPMAPPIFSFSQVERWLRRPNLVRDFFAGAPLPPAAIPEAEYAKLTKGDN